MSLRKLRHVYEQKEAKAFLGVIADLIELLAGSEFAALRQRRHLRCRRGEESVGTSKTMARGPPFM